MHVILYVYQYRFKTFDLCVDSGMVKGSLLGAFAYLVDSACMVIVMLLIEVFLSF